MFCPCTFLSLYFSKLVLCTLVRWTGYVYTCTENCFFVHLYSYQCLSVPLVSISDQPWQQEDPLMKTLLRMMKTGEVSRSLRIGKRLLLKGMNNLGILWRKRVKISSMEQSTWSLFRFGTLLCIVNLEFCQLSLLALKMSIVWKKLVSK